MRAAPYIAMVFAAGAACAAAAAAAACAAGCTPTTTVTTVNTLPFPAYERQIPIFLSGPPSQPHADASLIHVGDGLGGSTDAEMLGALRSAAAAAGCDAVVVVSIVGRARIDGLFGSCVKWLLPTTPSPALTPSSSAVP